MKNILVTGANGQLGSEIRFLSENFEGFKFFFTDVEELDITDFDKIDDFINQNNINYIVNCAAYTAVDKAEDEPEKSFLLNATAPGYLAKAANKNKAFLVHVSTDYVFDGKGNLPINEEVQTSPNSVYGNTKLEGEKLIAENTDDYMIIRTAWLYSPHGGNFVKTMLKYGKERGRLNVVFDQVGTPTYALDLAKVILDIIHKGTKTGVYHYSNEGVISWYDFAVSIIENAGVDCKVEPIYSHEFPAKANRPVFSVLDKRKIKTEFDIEVPYWLDSLKDCLIRLNG
jgi:dTDP-4-dehydrorhamnose reductase